MNTLILDSGNSVIKGKTATREAAFPHALKALTESQYEAILIRAGRSVPQKMGDVPRHTQCAAKARIAHQATTQFPGMRLREGVDEAGSLFGYLEGAGSDLQSGDTIELGLAVGKDGNVRV